MAKMSPDEYLKLVQEQQKALDPITLGASTISGIGNMWDSIAEQRDIQNAGRGDLADSVVGNSWTDIFNNRDRLAQGIQTVDNNRIDVSEVNDINTLTNIGTANNLQDNVTAGTMNGGSMFADAGEGTKLGATIGSFIPGGTLIGAGIGLGLGAVSGVARGIIGDINNKKNARALNARIDQANAQQINDIHDRAGIISQKQQREWFMHTPYEKAEGGLLNEFNTGGSHEENPLGGIPQGIASDGLPNLVEEGEVRSDFDDAKIFNNQDKNYTITEKDCEEYLLPKSVIGCNPAEAIKKLKKEYEDRVNDPVSIATMKEWDSRVFAFQEDKTAKLEEKRAKKAVKNMSDEEKAALMSSLAQPMAQQEGIDLSQPMYAKGGKIYIKPSKRGTFTAAAKKRGMGVQEFANKVVAHPENYSEAMRKKAQFAKNFGGHKHAIGGVNYLNYPFGAMGYGIDYITNGDYERDMILKNAPSFVNNLHNLPEVSITANRPVDNNTPWYDFNAEVRDNPLFPYLMSDGNTQVSPVNSNIAIKPLDDSVADQKPLSIAENYRPKFADSVNTELLAQRLRESLRYAPAIGAQLGAITAALQPKDYTLANRLEDLASEFRPVSAPHIGGYRRYTPYDVNLGDAENIGLTARALSANRGQNRATQGALNTAVLAKAQEASAKRNLAAQQANEANRLATDQYNLGIDQFNAQRDSTYDQLNQQILANRINMLGQAAQARDASRTAWASNINTTAENAFNQLGNVGRDNWNRNQFLLWIAEHPTIAKELGIKLG